MVDITCFSPGTGSPSTAFSATPSTSLTAASASEYGEVRELSAVGTGGTAGERGRMSRLIISRSNGKSGDLIQNIIYVPRSYLPDAGMSDCELNLPRPPSQSCHSCSINKHPS